MPQYAADPEQYEGSEFPPIYPCDILDANKEMAGQWIVFFDTETGIIIETVQEQLPDGSTRPKIVNDHLVHKVSVKPAPLTIVPYDPDNYAKPIITQG